MRRILPTLAVTALLIVTAGHADADVLYLEEFDPDVPNQYTYSQSPFRSTGEVEAATGGNSGEFNSADFRDDNFRHGGDDITLTTDAIGIVDYVDLKLLIEIGTASRESGESGSLRILNALDDSVIATVETFGIADPYFTADEFDGATGPVNLTEDGIELVYSLDNLTLPSSIKVQFVQSAGSQTDQVALGYIQVDGTLIPEPASFALLGLGSLVMLRRRQA